MPKKQYNAEGIIHELRETERLPVMEALRRVTRREYHTVDVLYSSDDHTEGARAFTEKRKRKNAD